MTEDFLQFIWGERMYDQKELQTISGVPLQILDPGKKNLDQGPDFLEAHIRLGEIEWWGNIELHLESKGWFQHQHHQDELYNSTILHVVLKSDHSRILRADGTEIPELSLEGLLEVDQLKHYNMLYLSQDQIACQAFWEKGYLGPSISFLEKLGIERLVQKAEAFKSLIHQLKGNWEQMLWEQISGFIAGKVNKEAFAYLTRQLPFDMIKKHLHDPLQLEALLFGKAGLLHKDPPVNSALADHTDHYYYQLWVNWQFLIKKLDIDHSIHFPMKFLRMRPAAFPTIRLSQLANLVYRLPHLITLLEKGGEHMLYDTAIHSSPYWENHYRFFELTSWKKKTLGRSQKTVILVNVILPISYLYGIHHGRTEMADHLLTKLRGLPAEKNRISKKFQALGGENQHALHSQAWIQLYKQYCLSKRCFDCSFGKKIIQGKIADKVYSSSVASY